jgi:hypothetical protein
MTWRLFGNAGITRYEDRPVPEVFSRAAPAVMGFPWRAAMFKTLFRNDGSYARLGVHRPQAPDPARMATQRWFDGAGRALPASYRRRGLFSPFGRDNYRLAQLNHYALGSAESYVLKCDRGRANRTAPTCALSYWVERNLCQTEDRSLADRFGTAEPMRSGLRADPVLEQSHRAAVAWRQNRFLELMRDESLRSLYLRLLMAPASRIPDAAQNRFLLTFSIPEQ